MQRVVRDARPLAAGPRARACAATVVVVTALLLAGCGSVLPRPDVAFPGSHQGRSGGRPTPAHRGGRRGLRGLRAPRQRSVSQSVPLTQQLPRGGRRILGRYRVVAYYGAPGGGQLGVLGVGTPEFAARSVERTARGFRGFGLPVQPAMELIATVAQASPGPDGDYSEFIGRAAVRRYLRVAHQHHMLLILDVQPGRSTFLREVKWLRPFLLDPSVGVALDSEWKVSQDETPGDGLIGSSDASDINAVAGYLSRLVRRHGLPDKLLIVHEFTTTMLPARQDIRTAPGIETVFHADGFGTPELKRHVYRHLAFPGRPFGAGFKLFFTEDSRLMRPAEVMRLRPRPDVITYQ